MLSYAEVAVDAPVRSGRAFSYHIPEPLPIVPGQLVWVPFGRRILQGIVMEVAAVPQVAETKAILQPVEPAPLLDAAALSLAQWLSRYYLCSLFDAAALFLPPGFKAHALSRLRPAAVPADAAALVRRQDQTRAALQALAEKGVLTEVEFTKLLGRNGGREVNRLIAQGLIRRQVELPRPRRFHYVNQLLPAADPEVLDQWSEKSGSRAPRQQKLLQAVREQPGGYTSAQANKEFGSGVVQALVQKGLLGLEWVRQENAPEILPPLPSDWPESAAPPPAAGPGELTLTPMQADALARIIEALDNPAEPPRPFLLHGVTGSGKTEVYLRAMEHIVARGQQAIFLVPEIALTPQTVQRVNARFPGQVAVLHSGLTARQKFDQWWKIREGDYAVVVGPRSALFAPLPNLGLLVIDEEHEGTYKQSDIPPFYHARTVALELARRAGAGIILGSATPDVESYHHAQRGRYRLLELPYRIRPSVPAGTPLVSDSTPSLPAGMPPVLAGPPSIPPSIPANTPPIPANTLSIQEPPAAYPGNGDNRAAAAGLAEVEICDMRLELRRGNRSIFSRALSAALTDNIAQGRQAILFLNRRGSAPIVQCRDCGYVVTCSGCAVSLTYHAAESRLRCHRCNRRSRPPQTCRQCRGPHIRQLGIGTQRVVEEVRQLLPGIAVERWDADAARSGPGPAETMRRLAAGETRVVVGTQLVAKGLDVPNVTLVGVVLADVGLHWPDFRAGERAFGLLCQVAGRAGRGAEPGRVIIQTYNPDHYAVAAAARQDYAALYQTEIAARHQQGNPPFNRLAHLLYQNLNPTLCQQQATTAARLLRQRIRAQGLTDLQVIGPAPGLPERVRGQHRWHIILRGRNLHRFLEEVDLPHREVIIDIDPLHLL